MRGSCASGLGVRRSADDGSSTACPIQGVGLAVPAWAWSGAGARAGAAIAAQGLWALVCEFPAVPWALMERPPSDALIIEERAWRAPSADLYVWDRALGGLCEQPRWLVVQGEEDGCTLGDTAREILTRYQRLVPRTNADSSTQLFRNVLSAHRALHDLSLPLVRADYDHALDVWQWTLRLMPAASLALQLAALFHDIERLLSEAERRIEHTAPDYQAFKNAHAAAGAGLAARVLAGCGVDRTTSDSVARLIREHEQPRDLVRSGDAGLLADADALSFFSLNSPGFADYYGAEHTHRKVRYTLGRMSSAAVRRLVGIRLRADVARVLAEVAQAEASATLTAVCA
jgi:hypothetical protein